MRVYRQSGTNGDGSAQWTMIDSSTVPGTWSGVCNSPHRVAVDIPEHAFDSVNPAWTYLLTVTARKANGATAKVLIRAQSDDRDVWFDGSVGPSRGQFVEAQGRYGEVTNGDLWSAGQIAMLNGHLAAKRFTVLDRATTELSRGLCGQVARDAYFHADGKWCSEFAAYVYSGANINMRACMANPESVRIVSMVTSISPRRVRSAVSSMFSRATLVDGTSVRISSSQKWETISPWWVVMDTSATRQSCSERRRPAAPFGPRKATSTIARASWRAPCSKAVSSIPISTP
jgi:hypothetical protein